jgi:hypothetical protein
LQFIFLTYCFVLVSVILKWIGIMFEFFRMEKQCL